MWQKRLSIIYVRWFYLFLDLVALRERLLEGLPLVLALQGLLVFLQLLDVANIVFYPTVHRGTMVKRFELGFSLVVPLVLLLVAWVAWMLWSRQWVYAVLPFIGFGVYPVMGFAASLSIVTLFGVVVGLYVSRMFEGLVKSLLVLVSAFEGLALLHWLVFIPLGVDSPMAGIASLELDLFYVVSYLAPLLVLPLMFMWLLKLIVGWGWGIKFDSGESVFLKKKLDKVWIYLSLTVLLSVFAVVYPYFPGVNPRGLDVGVDIPHYVALARMVDADVSQAFSVMGGSRPMIFLVIFGFQRLTGLSVEASVNYLPVLLAPVLVLSVFFLAKVVLGNDYVAVWSAFFTSTGIQITVGIYSYFLTNMLALSLAFFSAGLLLMALRKSSYFLTIVASILGGLLLFTHPWTFDQLLGSFGVFTLFVGYEGWRSRRYESFKLLFLYVGLMGVLELAKRFLFHGVGGLDATSTVTGNLAGLGGFWATSIFSFRYLYGGFMSNIFLLSLSLVGIYLLKRSIVEERFLVIYCALSSLVFFVGDDVIKTRLLFNLPIAIFSGIGLYRLQSSVQFIKYRKYVFSGVILASLTYLFRCLANLV
jgi:hypothetical protein